MALESAAEDGVVSPFSYEVAERDDRMILSVAPLMREIVTAVRTGEPVGRIAARFHETVARMLADAAIRASETTGVHTISLSGGCFANRRLLGRLVELLEERQRRVLYHRQVPCGDGGLAFGQAVAAASRYATEPQFGKDTT
jgi:hydrogenase maturation protein HypF